MKNAFMKSCLDCDVDNPLECPECDGRGIILTDLGMDLVEFLNQADSRKWLARLIKE